MNYELHMVFHGFTVPLSRSRISYHAFYIWRIHLLGAHFSIFDCFAKGIMHQQNKRA